MDSNFEDNNQIYNNILKNCSHLFYVFPRPNDSLKSTKSCLYLYSLLYMASFFIYDIANISLIITLSSTKATFSMSVVRDPATNEP